MKKLTAFVVALSISSPVAAYDFGTAGTVAGLAGTGIGLALTFGAIPAIGTVALGAAVAGVVLDNTEAEGSKVTVQLDPNAPLVVPPGWPNASTPPTQPATAKYYLAIMGAGTLHDTKAAACAAAAQSVGWPTYTTAYNSSNQTCAKVRVENGAIYEYYSIASIVACPTGFTNNSGTCVPNTSAPLPMRPSDNVCGIKRVANSFSADPQDPDCATKPATVDVQPNAITQTRPDGTQKSVVINGDGSTTVTDSRPNHTSNTTETNTTHLSAPDASGKVKVTGQASGAVNGTGSAAGGVAVPTFDKSGLATESTQAGIKADTGAIKDALTGEGVDNSLAAEKGLLDGAMDSIAAMFSGEAAKDSGIEDNFSFDQFLPQSCGCTPLTIDYHGHHASFDWCSPMETIKGALAWALGILTALFVLVQFKVAGGR